MCGRFNLFADGQQIALAFGLSETPLIVPRYNIAPTQPVAAVRPAADGTGRELTFFYWGLIPSWSKDDSFANKLINARSETAHEKPSFRNAFKRRRCIVPATGFYEWQQRDGRKQPLHIHFENNRLFGIAGLWEEWQEIATCTLLTTAANPDVAPAHDRMPAILTPDAYDLWLDDAAPLPAVQTLLRPYAGDRLFLTPVSAYISAPANEGPRCIEPVA